MGRCDQKKRGSAREGEKREKRREERGGEGEGRSTRGAQEVSSDANGSRPSRVTTQAMYVYLSFLFFESFFAARSKFRVIAPLKN